MDAAAKFILRDKLKEKVPELTDDIIYKVISELDKMGALSNESVNSKGIDSEKKETKGLPQSFKMISPLWSGQVTLVHKEGFYGYKDSDDNIRLHAKNEKELSKKVAKYNKELLLG